jgi:hypothetical protein
VAAVAMMVSLRLAAGDIDGIRALAGPLSDLATRLLGPRTGRGTGRDTGRDAGRGARTTD